MAPDKTQARDQHNYIIYKSKRFYQKVVLSYQLFISRLDEAKKYRQVDREQINKLNQQLSDCESEINLLRRTIESLETERARDKATINRLQQEVDKLRIVSKQIHRSFPRNFLV